MDSRRGGCCIARYDNGGCAYDRSKVNNILLRYRPIAPKPAFVGANLKRSPEELEVKGGRGRRKLMKNDFGNNNKESKNNKNSSRKRKVPEHHPPALVTLQLLPESPERKDSPAIQSSSESLEVEAPTWLSFSNNSSNSNNNNGYGGVRKDWGFLHMFDKQQTMKTQSVTYNTDSMIGRVVSSWVKVESIAYTWLGEPCWLGSTDEEKVMSLQEDTCPGFISDGANRVSWINRSYIEMFGGGGLGAEMVVCLVLGDGMELGKLKCGGFTCRVRVITCSDELGKKSSSLTLPCDVWRMDFGGFAWRLDTKVALSLST